MNVLFALRESSDTDQISISGQNSVTNFVETIEVHLKIPRLQIVD